MADHEPTTIRTSILVSKFVIADQHVHCTRLENKHIDAHGELGEHGDERVVDLMNAQSILPNVIETYDPSFRYNAPYMTSFRSTSVANNSGTLWLTTSCAMNV